MTFRWKTTLTIVILTALALGGAFAAVSAAFNGLQRRQLDASLRSVAAQEALEAPAHHFLFSEGPGPAANDVGPLTKYGVIFDESGKVLSATPPFDTDPPPRQSLKAPVGRAFDLWFRRSHLRGVLVPIPAHPGKILFLATSRDDLDGDEVFLYRAMLVAFMVAVLWVGAVAYWMGGRLTLAHRDIASVVRQVSGGDLTARVRVKPSDPELDRLGREINEMVVRLDGLVTSQQRFIAHAAHELRTPLAALYGELQQARRKERDNAYYTRTIDAALAACRHLNTLTEDLLTLARTRAKVDEASGDLALERVLGEARAWVQPLADQRQVRIRVSGDGSSRVPDRHGDTVRLVRNLLENAVRHSPAGSEVEVTSALEAGQVVVRVSDAGPGVDAADRHAIFEPFFRAKGAASGEGAGLGLGIAREIARAHGGDVWLDAAPPDRAGARFVIRMPLRQREPPRPAA